MAKVPPRVALRLSVDCELPVHCCSAGGGQGGHASPPDVHHKFTAGEFVVYMGKRAYAYKAPRPSHWQKSGLAPSRPMECSWVCIGLHGCLYGESSARRGPNGPEAMCGGQDVAHRGRSL